MATDVQSAYLEASTIACDVSFSFVTWPSDRLVHTVVSNHVMARKDPTQRAFHLTVARTCDNDEDVVRVRGFHLPHGFVDDGREVRWARECDSRRDLIVAPQHFVKASAGLAEWHQRKDALVARRGVPKAERWDEVIVVERLQRAANDRDDALLVAMRQLSQFVDRSNDQGANEGVATHLVRVRKELRRVNVMETLATERDLASPLQHNKRTIEKQATSPCKLFATNTPLLQEREHGGVQRTVLDFV